MIKYTGKESKSFITRLTKLINGVNKYNVESILLVQIYKCEDKFEPVIISKPIDIDIFDYLKTIYSDNEIYNRSLEYMDMSKIKKKIDKMYYSPVIISSMTAIPFIKLSEKDIFKKDFVLPNKYSNKAEYSDSYFIVTDLYKEFVKERTISGVDENLNFYDTDDFIYDTSSFIYKNDINKSFESDFVERTSPKHYLPIYLDEEDDVFLDIKIRDLLVKLNVAAINREMKDLIVLDKDIGVVSSDLALSKVEENISKDGTFILKDDTGNKSVLSFSEFFKVNPKEILFIKKEYNVNIEGTETPIYYAGLSIKTKDYILYIFYKYFDYGIGE